MRIRELAEYDHVLVAFDGPVAQLQPSALVAERLRVMVAEGRLPRTVATTDDPSVILDYAATIGPATERAVHTQLCWIEHEATLVAAPAPGVEEAFAAIVGLGARITVVSGLSSGAVRSFLLLHDLAPHVRYLAARNGSADRAAVPPAPDLITAVIHQSAVPIEWAVFVGSAKADLAAARAAGVTTLSVVEHPVYWDAEDVPVPPLLARRGTPSSARPERTA
nr:HAD hydrolase-like protein [Kibdelosporangium sp. MJ126-NF4]CEL23022.1 Haloacid dehalogenase-like hydrolase [Kibdelosporangium sp. MJ126-NF4]CTQ90161.1 Haloacid dehalogenase-like hydrolase [Kibdelosporangium sp. MJ126-NF4]